MKKKIDSGGPTTIEKKIKTYISLNVLTVFPHIQPQNYLIKTSGPNILKIFDDYLQIHGVPRSICLDQVRCLVGNNFENFSKQKVLS